MTRGRVIGTVVVWLALSGVLWAAGARPAVVAIGGVVAAIAAVLLLTIELADAVVAQPWPRRHDVGRPAVGSNRWVVSLRHQLDRDRRYGSSELHETLVELLDDRLRTHRQLDRATDPVAAIGALPPALQRLVTDPPRPLTVASELREIVSEIEAL